MATRRLEVTFVGDTKDLEAANRRLKKDLEGLKKRLDDTGKSTEGLGKDTDDLGRRLKTVSSGVDQAGNALKQAQIQIDKTGKVSASTLTDLKRLGSDGVAGLDRNLNTTRETLKRAQAEIAATGEVSRRTRKDLDALGDGSKDTDRKIRGMGGGFGGAGDGAARLASAMAPLGGILPTIAAGAAAVGPALIGAAGSAIALAAALAPLAGLAGAGAVALTAFGQAAGVTALAAMGIGDALKEQMGAQDKAAKAASTGAETQKAAARAIAQAQEGVRSANERVRDSTESLTSAEQARGEALKGLKPAITQARRDLADMKSSLTGAVTTEKQAALSLAEAWKALGAAQNPVDVAKLASAQQALTQSTLSEQRAVRGLTEARQALEDLMKPADPLTLADAQDAVADATRDQTRAALALGKAQKAAVAAAADPTMSDADKAQAKLDLADAENAVGDATRASTHAQQDLAKLQAGPDPRAVAKATQDIADAQQEVADAQRNTAQATADVRDAQKGADPAAVAKATLDVVAAEQALTEATRERRRITKDLAAAEKAGVNGSDAVVAARQRITDANKQVVAADRQLRDAERDVTRALQAVKDAQSDAATSAGVLAASSVDLNEKFNALPPAAQAFVRVLQGMKPKLDALRATAAAGLFPGVTAGLQEAAKNFAPLQRVVGKTAEVLGGLAKRAGELVGSKGFGKDLETIGDRNALIIDRIGRAAIYAGDAFRHILVAAGPLTTWLAKVTVEWAKNFDGAVKSARESGKLADFFQSTKNTLVKVGGILGDLAVAFFNVGKAAAPFGRDILDAISGVTSKFADWTKSVKGQTALADFFKKSNELMAVFVPAVAEAAKSLGSLAFTVLPVYAKILKELGPLAGPVIQALIAFKLASTAANSLSAVAALANPLGLVVLAVAALGAAFFIAYKKSETFRDVVDKSWAAVKKAIASAIKYVQGWLVKHREDLDRVVDALQNLGTAAVWVFEKVMLPVVERVFPIIVGILQGFLRVVGGIVKTISGVLTGDWAAAWEGVKEIASGAITALGAVLSGSLGLLGDAAKLLGEAIWGGLKLGLGLIVDVLTAPFRQAWDALLSFFGVASPSKLFAALGGDLIAGLVNGLEAGVTALLDAAKWVGDTLVAGVKAYVSIYKDVGGWLLEKIVAGFKAVTSGIAGAAEWLGKQVVSAVHDTASSLVDLGGWVLAKVVGGFSVASDALKSVGTWLYTQVMTAVHGISGSLLDLGGWVLATVVNGLTFVSDKGISGVTQVGEWLLKQLKSAFTSIKGGISDLGGSIMGWIINGLEKAAFDLQSFLNKIIGLVNKIPGVAIPEIKVLKKDKNGEVTGLARGGAFARTGGYVNSPITLMGEEAPAHSEWVIPENPSYRSRALKLWAAAGQRIGAFAEGGVYGKDDLTKVWSKANPGQGDPNLMAAIALAESSGILGNVGHDPGGTLGLGLWQITTGFNDDLIAKYGGQNAMLTNATANADAAGDLLARQGLDAWVVYNTGAYKQFMDGGGGILGKIGGAIGGAVGDIAGMASGIIGKLPSADGLGWLEGTGKYALGKVKDWIGEKVKGLFGGGGSGAVPSAPSGVQGLGMFDGRQVAQWIIPELKYARAHGWDGNLTSGWRSASQVVNGPVVAPQGMSEHQGTQYPHGAVDFGGPYDAAGLANKMAFIAATQGYTGHRLLSALGFRDDGHMSGTGHYKGGVYGGGVLGSYESGTPFVPQTGPYLLHRGEKVTPASQNKQDGPLVHIEHMTVSNEEDVEVFARRLGWQLAR